MVDGSPEQFEPILQRSLAGSFPAQDQRPVLDIVDRGTFETIQRLIGAGHLRPSPETSRLLYESPELVAKVSPRPDRRAEARKIFEPARRKLQMSDLLWSNGFTSEALPALLGVVGISLKALAFLREIPVPEEQGPFEPAVLSSLLGSLEFDKLEISKISELNDLCSNGAQEQAEASQELMTTGHRVFDIVEERLHQAALR